MEINRRKFIPLIRGSWILPKRSAKEYVLIWALRTQSNPKRLDQPLVPKPPLQLSLKSNQCLKSIPAFQFELLFCIQEEDDSRLRMYVESLRSKFPKVDCQVREGWGNVNEMKVEESKCNAMADLVNSSTRLHAPHFLVTRLRLYRLYCHWIYRLFRI